MMANTKCSIFFSDTNDLYTVHLQLTWRTVRPYHLLKSICNEWSTVRSVGQAGWTLLGSPPSAFTASLIAARSTRAGIPLQKTKKKKSNPNYGFNSLSYYVDKKQTAYTFVL